MGKCYKRQEQNVITDGRTTSKSSWSVLRGFIMLGSCMEIYKTKTSSITRLAGLKSLISIGLVDRGMLSILGH
jgi:hypothetical protein